METKQCAKCKIVKPITEFYAHNKTKYQAYCKSCKKAENVLYNRKPERKLYNKMISQKLIASGHYKEYFSRPEVKLRQAANMRRYAKDPLLRIKHLARWIVARRLKSGKIQKQPCAFCGKEQVEAHHKDYNKPLLIVWLCPDCHKKEHLKFKAAAAESEAVKNG